MSPVQELCNADDDDCDGRVDEAFPQLGQACMSGVGDCVVAGNVVCDPEVPAQTVCDAVAGEGVGEVCDEQDNDCDQRVDEGFDLTRDVDNCGACERRCVLAEASAACVDSVCRVEACAEGFVDLDEVADNGCECDARREDPPDSENLDTNCDGLDGDASAAVFVSPTHGDDGGAGRRDAPLRSLERAVELAREQRAAVYLDAGEYALEATLVVDVDLHGGYRFDPQARTWARGARANHTAELRGAATVLRYEALTRDVVLDRVVVEAAAAEEPGQSSVAVVALDVRQHLTIRDAELLAGSGAYGRDGATGVAGDDTAEVGDDGQTANDRPCPLCGGSGGGNPACPDQTAGGRGGHGATGADGDLDGEDGCDGGVPGAQGEACPAGGEAPGGEGGAPGDDGGSGTDGAASAGGTSGGQIGEDGLWTPAASPAGETGGPGGGAGGGGGGAADDHDAPGGGGGGGGGGGCGGAGGGLALGGGGSFALYVRGTLNEASVVEVVASRLSSGRGGDGGDGGDGGAGAPGGRGGTGPRQPGCAECRAGGSGGRGAPGGCGGPSGGGGGGPSFAVLRVSASDDPARLDRSRVVFLDAEGRPAAPNLGSDSSGTPGSGGAACGPAEGAPPGGAGLRGQIGCCGRAHPADDCGDLTRCDD